MAKDLLLQLEKPVADRARGVGDGDHEFLDQVIKPIYDIIAAVCGFPAWCTWSDELHFPLGLCACSWLILHTAFPWIGLFLVPLEFLCPLTGSRIRRKPSMVMARRDLIRSGEPTMISMSTSGQLVMWQALTIALPTGPLELPCNHLLIGRTTVSHSGGRGHVMHHFSSSHLVPNKMGWALLPFLWTLATFYQDIWWWNVSSHSSNSSMFCALVWHLLMAWEMFHQNPTEGTSSRRTQTRMGKTLFVEHRTGFHVYHSFHRLWIFFILMLQVMIIHKCFAWVGRWLSNGFAGNSIASFPLCRGLVSSHSALSYKLCTGLKLSWASGQHLLY